MLTSLASGEEVALQALANHFLGRAYYDQGNGLGMLYAAIGQREQARTVLSTAIALYRDMDMTFWLPQAEAALGQVEA